MPRLCIIEFTEYKLKSCLKLSQRRSRRNPEICITDINYADDIAVTTDSVNVAMTLLHNIEEKSSYIGLKINTDKTEYITLNQNQHGIQCITLKSREGHNIKRVEDFKYLGSYIGSTERDVNIRIAKAWAALNNMNVIWKSNLTDKLKRNFFRAAVESVLMYVSITWTRVRKKSDFKKKIKKIGFI